MRIAAIISFIRLGRPQFLVGGFLMYGLGAAIAVRGGARFSVGAWALGQAAISAIQLMTHYANDYFDFEADRANTTPTRWSGGSRVLPGGGLPRRAALTAAIVFAGLGLALVGVVAGRGGAGGGRAAALLLVALALAWEYSAPPLALHARSLGELTTAAVVTGLTPLVGFTLQAGGLAAPGLAALAVALGPLAALQFVMLLGIEFPDAAGDAAAGKRTLVVRLGGARAAALYRALLVLIYGAIPLLLRAGLPVRAAVAAAIGAPLGLWQFRRLGAGAYGDPARFEGMAFRAVAMLVATAAAELAAFTILSST